MAGGGAGEGPAVVEHVVVASADEGEVVEVGGSAAEVGHEVVGIGPFGWPVTAGDDAASVAVAERSALRGGGEAGAAAEVEDLRSVHHDAPQDRLGEPAADEGAGDGSVAVDIAPDVGEI